MAKVTLTPKAKVDKTKKFGFSDIHNLVDTIAKKTAVVVVKEDYVADRISTGIFTLNACISGSLFGGIKGDAITVWAGPEASGKTYLALNVCREAQKKDYQIFYIDTENSLSRQDFPRYGIKNDLDHLILLNENRIERLNQFLTQFLDELRAKKMAGETIPKMIMVLDSLAQLASNKEKDDLLEGNSKQDMTKAKSIGSLFRSITMDLAYLEIPFMVNNQTYQTMDMFPKEIMKGGKSLYYSASNITFLGKSKYKTGQEDEYDLQSGILVTAKAIKNRQSKPKKVQFVIDYEKGCNPYSGLEMFCQPQFFDKIGIAKGKMVKLPKPVEKIDESTGEVTMVDHEFNATGNRWYIRHLGKSVTTKELHTPIVFTEEVLNAIEPLAQAYFKYRSVEEIEEEHRKIAEKAEVSYEELTAAPVTDEDVLDDFIDDDLLGEDEE